VKNELIDEGQEDYDAEGNLIHCLYKNGYEAWFEYVNGKESHRRYKTGEEIWYDDKGRVIQFREEDGTQWGYEYDANGHEIHTGL